MCETNGSSSTEVRMNRRHVRCRRQFVFCVAALSLLVFYNEWLVYYVVLLQCQWPALDINSADFTVLDVDSSNAELHAMVFADTHLLGTREGHWFDRLRREWQMERSFQAAMLVHDPEVVFVLGDLFDEGKWCSDNEFQYYISRFRKMFRTDEKTQTHVVVGNHDIGFHYMTEERKRHRFTSAFGAPSVRMVQVKDNTFVLLNSIAFEGDACDMCQDAEIKLRHIAKSLQCAKVCCLSFERFVAEIKLRHIAKSLQCAKGSLESCTDNEQFKYTKPIILQHFPMYRLSDRNCSGPDTAPPDVKNARLKPRWDCLSKEASYKLVELLEPRLILDGHTHQSCQTVFNGTPEWTVASFSWRYKNNPSFLLLTISNNNYAIARCFLPQESTVVYTYIVGCVLVFSWFLFSLRLSSCRRGRKLN